MPQQVKERRCVLTGGEGGLSGEHGAVLRERLADDGGGGLGGEQHRLSRAAEHLSRNGFRGVRNGCRHRPDPVMAYSCNPYGQSLLQL